jgi:hypothetical protein
LSNYCADCDRLFLTPRGLGSHRFAYHGVKGRSPAAIRRSSKGLLIRKPRALVVRPGEVYGLLTVLNECNEPHPSGGGGRSHARVKCTCTTEKLVSKSELITGRTISCGCHRDGKKKGAPWRALHTILCRGAKQRNLPVELTPDHVQLLGQMLCFYCGREPSNMRSPRRSYQTLYNGIDRTDNQQGYVLGNVLPCCRYCNRAKRDYSLEEFIDQIQRYGSKLTVKDVKQKCIEIGRILRGGRL